MSETPARPPYGVHAKLEVPAAALGHALAQWRERDDTRPQPEARQAANRAMDAVDGMLRELYLLRGRLVEEIRASDDADMARSAALLDRSRRRGR